MRLWIFAVGLVFGCGASPKQIASGALTVAGDVCKELADAGEPEWVTVACAADGIAQGIVVRLPRRQWSEMRQAKADAGPGL